MKYQKKNEIRECNSTIISKGNKKHVTKIIKNMKRAYKDDNNLDFSIDSALDDVLIDVFITSSHMGCQYSSPINHEYTCTCIGKHDQVAFITIFETIYSYSLIEILQHCIKSFEIFFSLTETT